MFSQSDILSFASFFSGAKEFYGVTLVGDIVEGKAKSTSTCIHEPPMPSVYSKHLCGDLSMGISPLKADDTIEFGVIDIDYYKGDLMAIVRAIYEYDLPICPCFSKSKKLHLYFFFSVGTAAEDAVAIMRWYAMAFGCDRKVEIFPKQTFRSTANKAYSWINLPYANAEDMQNHRKMITKDFEYASLDEFLTRADLCKKDIAAHKESIQHIPCNDAPPCILTSLLLNDIQPGQRNNWLYSVGVYFKLKDEDADLESLLTEINERLPDPLPAEELRNTILKSFQRKTCFYICASMNHCDKAYCSKLEAGISSNKSTGLQYGDLTQYMVDPPYYEWIVNGQKMTFYSETELLRQEKFRALCLRQLHIVPRKVDENIWAKIITKACENIQVHIPDSRGGDFTSGSHFYDLACDFFSNKRKAANMSQVALGRVYVDEEHKEFVFTANAFLTFMIDTKSFKGLTQMEMKTRLEEMGAYKQLNYWRLSVDAIPLEDKKIEIDFNNHEGESEDF